jgi:hypothetical protein
MEKIVHNVIEKSSLYLDLSDSLLVKLDLFLSNTDLSEKQQEKFIKLLEEVYSEAYVNSLTD